MPDDKEPIPQFAARIKKKYPEYAGMNDTLLVQKIVSKYPEYAGMVDMPTATATIKKKEISSPLQFSQLKNISPKESGEAPSFLGYPLLKNKVEEGGMKRSPYPTPPEEKPQEQDLSEDPIAYQLRPFREQAASDYKTLKELSPFKSPNVAESVVPKGYGTSLLPIEEVKKRKYAENNQKLSEHKLQEEQARAYQSFFKNGKEALGYLQKVNDEKGGLPEGNETVNFAAAKAERYLGLKDAVDKNTNLEELPVDLARKADPNLDKQILAIEGGRETDRGLDSYRNTIPQVMQGAITKDFVYDEDVNEIAKDNPKLQEQIDYYKNGGLYKSFPDYGRYEIRNQMSREYELNRKNKIAGAIGDKTQYLNAMADRLYENNPELKKLADEMKGDWTRNVKSSGLVDEYLSGAEGSFGEVVKSGRDLVGLGPTTGERVYQELEKQYGHVDTGVKGIWKPLGEAANFGGMVTGMVLQGGALKALKFNPRVANAIITSGNFYDQEYNKAIMKTPDNPDKAKVMAAIMTGTYILAGNAIPAGKLGKVIDKVRPGIETELELLGEKGIQKGLGNKVVSIVKDAVGNVAKGVGEMTAITKLGQEVDRIAGMSPEDQLKFHGKNEGNDELLDVARSMTIGLSPIGLISAYGSRNSVAVGYNSMASHPDRYLSVLDKMKMSGDISEWHYQRKVQDITLLNKTKQELNRLGIDEKNQSRFLLEAMEQKYKAEEMQPTNDKAISKQQEKELQPHEDVKEKILAGEKVPDLPEDHPFPSVSITEPRKTGGEVTKDGVTVISPKPEPKTTSIIMPSENKVADVVPLKKQEPQGEDLPAAAIRKAIDDKTIKGMNAEMAKTALDQEGGAEQLLKDIADQALNKQGGKEMDAENMKRAREDYGNELVDMAIEKYPKEEVKSENENISQPDETTQSVVTETQTGTTEPTPETPKAAEGGTGEPPKPPEDTAAETEQPKGNKSLAVRLVEAKNVPEAAKAGIREKGLTYEPKSQKEAQEYAMGIIDEMGMDEAVLHAQGQKFGGDVNTLVQTEALNRLAEMSEKETDPAKKLEHDKKFAQVSIELDEWLRKQGRGISAVNYFYKKSPLGIQLVENAKRKQDFEDWAKPKDKPWKEFFDEMMKEPEFADLVKGEVKKERAGERQERKDKVHKTIDDTLSKWADKLKAKGAEGAQKQGIGVDEILKAVGVTIKAAYDAGEAVAKIVQDAIDYISEKLGHSEWGEEEFRKEWEQKLADRQKKKPLTDEELKAKLLDKFRNKLKGLTDKQKEDVVRKSFAKIVESGGLDYQDFRKIIADVTGRGEMTDAEAARLKELVKQTNAVDEAGKRAREERTQEARKDYREAEIKAGAATKELNTLLYNKPNIVKRLTSLMQLNTLGIPALVNNPIYNVINHLGIRLPVGLIKTGIERAIQGGAKLIGKDYTPETDVFSLRVQREFFKKLGLGTRESVGQFLTGLNRMDYLAKEIQGQQIRPATAIRDLWAYHKGEKNLTKAQVIDKIIQASPPGITAEIIARTLNLGDKPQRFAAEGAQAAAFAKKLGLKDIDYDLFIDFPREEAYRVYKKQGLSDEKAAEKADYIKDTIVKEGERSTFQQDNMLNDMLGRVFGGKDSGIGGLIKATTISPYIKIPSNAYWSYYNIVNPEVAMLQSMIYAGKAFAKSNGAKFSFDKPNSTAAKDLHEAKYWLAHAAVGMATRGVIIAMANAGIFTPANTGDDTKKEREGEQFYEPQGTVNVSKLAAWLRGDNPDDVKNGLVVNNRWFGHWGTVGNTIARKNEEMTEEQKKNQSDFWDAAIGGMELYALQDFEQGVFGNTQSLLSGMQQAIKTGDVGQGLNSWGVNTLNLFANIVHPAASAQVEKAMLPYYTKNKADNFMQEVKNSMLTRSAVLRKVLNQYPPAKIGIWGDKLDKKDNVAMRLFGISRANDDNFAQPIYEDYKKSNDIGLFPPAVTPEVNGKKLNSEQVAKLEEYVGHARKNYIAPFINDQATIEGFDVKYSQLEKDDKKYVLQYLYQLGKDDGVKAFEEQYPEFKKEEKEKDYNKDVQKELFRILSKYNK